MSFLQLHFTELAEGFSVGAITYYTIGLNAYLLKAVDKVLFNNTACLFMPERDMSCSSLEDTPFLHL